MDAKASPNLVLELPKAEPLNEKHLDELNSYDLTKLLFNKINSLNRPKQAAKSRSGSINELPPYSPTKLTELNFYSKTKSELDVDDDESDECEDEEPKNEQIDEANLAMFIRKNSATDQTRSSNNQILTKLLQFKQIKQLNDLLSLNDPQHRKMSISLQDQLELDSLSSSEPNREWSIDSNEFALQCLNRHNFLRKRHNVPNLILSKNLCIYSKDWADIIARNELGLEKRFSNRYGENVFVMQLDQESTSLNGAIPVDHWYQKGKNYDYDSEFPKASTSEFTQLIWRSTRFLGVACALSKSNKFYVVASYSQCGNFPNQMLDNVFRPVAK